ncbi:MAG TPA: AsmA family protein [Myxococcales bacterium]|nr:AsmA family protein [Myxococcales bacterium]
MKRWQKIVGIAVAVVVLILVVGSLVLDSFLTSKAHEQAAQLSQEWKRPVRIDKVSTRIFTGLGARVSGVQIGAAQGESAPLVDLREVEVSVGLLPHFHVRSAEARGLTVNVERYADGSTNLEHFRDAMPKKEEPQPPPQKTGESDLSWLRVDHAALLEGKIALTDRSQQGRTIAIDHLDVVVNDLRAGRPLEVELKAAVLAQKQNLDVKLKSAPLPDTLQPTPAALSLHVDPPIDLAPLGPFAGKDLGLRGGTLDADFDADLQPIAVKGTIKLAGLDFAASDGGRKLDVTLDSDVKGDLDKGDLQIDKLTLDIGPASITGSGSARGIGTASPQMQGLQLVAHDLDPQKLAAYYPPLRKQLGGQLAGPIGLSVQGAGQALEVKLDLTPVKVNVPEQMTKAAGAPMTLLAHLDAAKKFDLKADLQGVDLRPGGSIDKAPGQRLDLAVDGTESAIDLKAHVLDDELQGHGMYDQKKFDVQVASSHLDLDKLLLRGTSKKKESKPPDPKAFAGIDGHAAVKIDKLTYNKQAMTDIVAEVVMKEDDVLVKAASLKAFGGTANASGSEMKLAHPQAPFHVLAKLDQVGLESLVALVTDHKLLSGKFNGDIDLQGSGDLAKTLNGNVEGHILDGVFYGKDLVASVSGPLARALPFGLAGKEGQGGSTSLGKDLPLSVTITNGMARLKKPLAISTPQGDVALLGGMRVDGDLALAGTVKLAPATVAAITSDKVKPAGPIPVSLELTGPAWSPSVTNLDLKPAVSQIVKEGGTALVGKALGVDGSKTDAVKQKAEDAAKDKLKSLFGK